MTTAEIESLLEQEPDIGATTPEPSLRKIVADYYRMHFGSRATKDLTHRYFTALLHPSMETNNVQ